MRVLKNDIRPDSQSAGPGCFVALSEADAWLCSVKGLDRGFKLQAKAPLSRASGRYLPGMGELFRGWAPRSRKKSISRTYKILDLEKS